MHLLSVVRTLRTVFHGALLASALAPSTSAAQTMTDKARRDDVIMIAPADSMMADAMERARRTLPQFLDALRRPDADMHGFAVKVGFGPSASLEYIWLTDPRVEGAIVEGTVSNAPKTMQAVRRNQVVRRPLAEVVDWTYQSDAGTAGNYTACALAARYPAAEAREFQRTYRIDCARLLGRRD